MSFDLDFDPTWQPEEVQTLDKAAEHLERFTPESQASPRVAFLLARWLRSHAASVQRIWVDERTVRANQDALDLARHIIDGPTS